MVALGDLDGLGGPDLVVANHGSHDISVLKGAGDGSFGAATSFPTGATTSNIFTGLALGFVNGDTKLDAVTANDTANSVSVFYGVGNGTFATAVQYTTANGPLSVAIGDLNADGAADLVTATWLGGVSVLMNDGNEPPSFERKPNIGTGGIAHAVAIAQLDGGGPPDLAIASLTFGTPEPIPDSSALRVLPGVGDGTFGAPVANINLGLGLAKSVAVADLDGDTDNDIVTAGTRISVSLKNGAGGFDTTTGIASSGQAQSVVIGDMNGDLAPDIVAGGGQVPLLLGNGNGTFAAHTTIGTESIPWSAGIGDANGDGRLDVMVANNPDNRVAVFLNRTNVTEVPDPPTSVVATPWSRKATVSWTAPAYDGGAAVSKYRVTATGNVGMPIVHEYLNPATTQTFLDLLNGVTYQFKVEAGNSVGYSLPSASSSAVITNPISAFALGGAHSCASAAGTVRCWGLNGDGQVGVLPATDQLLPKQVKVGTVALSGVTALTAGRLHTCALLSDKTVKCWGDNSRGQLGDTTVIDRREPRTVVVGPGAISPALANVTAITAGESHTCALLVNKQIKCWGLNANGQLGDSTPTERHVPTTVVVGPTQTSAALANVTAIAAGSNHTCALHVNKTVKCWGRNSSGQLGDSTSTERRSPRAVGTSLFGGFAALANVTAIAAGGVETCALLTNKQVNCWGSNAAGALGTGSVGGDRAYPASVLVASGGAALPNATAITVGGGFACAHVINSMKCWGANSVGQLGDTTNTPRAIPTLVNVGSISKIGAGSNHTCLLQSNGAFRCWGANVHGQLGDGSTTNRWSQVGVQGL